MSSGPILTLVATTLINMHGSDCMYVQERKDDPPRVLWFSKGDAEFLQWSVGLNEELKCTYAYPNSASINYPYICDFGEEGYFQTASSKGNSLADIIILNGSDVFQVDCKPEGKY